MLLNRKKCFKGFTLIELLVVIAIISLLVSILLPSLNTARKLARRTVCSVNMKNIGTALHLYNAEQEKFPYQRHKNYGQVFGEGLSALYSTEILDSPDSIWCVDDQNNPKPQKIQTNIMNGDNSAQCSYFYMYPFLLFLGDPDDVVNNGTIPPVEVSIVEESYGGLNGSYPYCNHSPDGSHVLFLDAHIKWVKPGREEGWIFDNIYAGEP